jgi:threonine dehydrogenase-like Zn-dependent dehydrogenase
VHASSHLQRSRGRIGRNTADPAIQEASDAIVRVVLACVCGSDLWYYRGEAEHAVGSIGHEFIGVVEDLGPSGAGLDVGDLVVAPFIFSDIRVRIVAMAQR